MFNHVTLGTDDLERARRFYEPVLATLGLEQPFAVPGALAFGTLRGPKLFVLHPFDRSAAHPGNGPSVALLAGDTLQAVCHRRPRDAP